MDDVTRDPFPTPYDPSGESDGTGSRVRREVEQALLHGLLAGATPEAVLSGALRRFDACVAGARLRLHYRAAGAGEATVVGALDAAERDALRALAAAVPTPDRPDSAPAPPGDGAAQRVPPTALGARSLATASFESGAVHGRLVLLLDELEAVPAWLEDLLEGIAPLAAAALASTTQRHRLTDLVENTGHAFVLLAPDRTVLFANRVAHDQAASLGLQPPTAGRAAHELVPAEQVADFERRLDAALAGRTVRAERRAGYAAEGRWFADHYAPVRSPGGEVRAVAFTSWEVTDRRRAEAMLASSAHALALLSATNREIVRARSEQDLFDRVCRAAVEGAGMSLAWVGRPDEQGVLRPVATAGHARSYATGVRVSVRADDPIGAGAGGVAYRTGTVQVMHAMESETAHPSWSHLARVHGLRSACVLPLVRGGRSIGVLGLYADDDPFDDATLDALETLSHDLAHALDALEERRARHAAELRLAHLNRALLLLSRSNHETVRARDEADLFARTCRVAVEEAGFPLAWICVPDGDGGLTQQAAHGEAMAYLNGIRLSCSLDEPEGRGPTGRAVRSGRVQIVADIAGDPGLAPWQETAKRFGLASVASVPLLRGGATVAVLNVYDQRVAFFDEAVVEVLEALQGDLSYALEAMHVRSEQERAERERHDSEERFRRFVAASDDLIFTLDSDGRYTSVHGAWPPGAGADPEKVLGRTVGEVLGDEVAAVHDVAFERARHGSSASYEWTIASEGGPRVVQTRLSPLLGTDRRTLGVLGVGRDITELRERELEARRLSSVVDQSPNVVVVTDLEGRITYVNDAFARVTGYAPEEVLGERTDLLDTGLLDEEERLALGSKVLSGEVWRGEVRGRRKDGSLYWESATVAPVRDASGRIQALTKVAEDVSERKQLRERVAHLTMHDRLTGLPNRALFVERLAHALPMARRHGRHVAVLAVDLDNFELVNETRGLEAGDRALVTIAQRLAAAVGAADTTAHFGGDEFWVLLPDLARPEMAGVVAEQLLAAIRTPLVVEGETVRPSATVGVALASEPTLGPRDLLHHAALALARAKGADKGGYHYFEPEMNAYAVDRMMIENGIRHGLEHAQFRIVVQPRVRLADGAVIGFESLLRWNHPELGAVPPERFVAMAEETGLIVPLGDFALAEAVRLAAGWNGAGRTLPLSVNLSAAQLRLPDIADRVAASLAEHRLPPERLHLEITETALMEDVERSASALHALRALGVRIEIDDFGIGYSSLNYLRLLPIDVLKIDRSFVEDLGRNGDADAIVRSILGLAEGLGMEVLAEGIETASQRDILSTMGCTMGQGFLFARPDDPDVHAALMGIGPGPDGEPRRGEETEVGGG